MKTRNTSKQYPPGLALSRIRFYLDTLEAHIGAKNEHRAMLEAMEAEADRRDAERVATGQR